eukprot:763764-Hanusia_phi.AAC.7
MLSENSAPCARAHVTTSLASSCQALDCATVLLALSTVRLPCTKDRALGLQVRRGLNPNEATLERSSRSTSTATRPCLPSPCRMPLLL